MPPDSGVAVGVDIDGAIAGDAAVIDGDGDAAAVAVGAAEYEGANDAAVGVGAAVGARAGDLAAEAYEGGPGAAVGREETGGAPGAPTPPSVTSTTSSDLVLSIPLLLLPMLSVRSRAMLLFPLPPLTYLPSFLRPSTDLKKVSTEGAREGEEAFFSSAAKAFLAAVGEESGTKESSPVALSRMLAAAMGWRGSY